MIRTICLFAFFLLIPFHGAVAAQTAPSPRNENGPALSGENPLHAVPEDPASAAPEAPSSSGFLLTEDEGLSIGIGGSVGESPYKKYDLEWMPLPLISYEGDLVYLRGTTAGLKLMNKKHVEISAFAGYDGTSFDSSNTSHERLRHLKDRQPSAELGLETRVLLPFGMVFANAAADVLDHSNGARGTVGYANSWEYGDFEFAPSAGLHWSSGKYNDYYYGVSDNEAEKSGLDAYDAGGGASPFVGATVSFGLADNWGVFCSGEVVFLNRAVKDSPMVGKSHTHSMTFGLMYGF